MEGTRGAGLFRLANGETIPVTQGLPNPKINCLLPNADGSLWIGTDGGLGRWQESGVEEPRGASSLRGIQILAMAKDRDGDLWLGSNSSGLIRFNSEGVSFLDRTGADMPAVTSIFEDREGDIWFASTNGLERLRDSAFITWSLSEGMPTDGSNPVFVDAENRAWFSPASGGLWWMKDERHGRIHAAGLDSDLVYSIAGNTSELWLGRQRGGLTRLRFAASGVAVTTWTTADGLAQDSVYSVYVARDGAV